MIFPAHCGMRVTLREPGHARMEMTVGPEHLNPMGTLHGGVPSTLADSAMGIAFAATLGDGESFTTLELKINFLRPVRPGTHLIADGVVVQRGKTIGLAECSVTDGDGKLIARASSTCIALRGDNAVGR